MNLALANGLLLVLVLLELAFISVKKKESIPWKEIIFNLNSGHILMWILRGVEITGFYMISVYFSFNFFQNWEYLAIWIFAFIAWDFCFYWLHRFHHKFSFLWAIHVIHHEGEHFSLSLGIRNSWYSSLTSFPFFIILAFIGIPVEIFVATSSIHYFIQFYNHNSIVQRSGVLEKIMITPSHHRVHHGVNPEYIDRNFGGTFIIWDKLFGTFQPELNEKPVIYGTKNYKKNYNIAWANNLPIFKLLKIPLFQTKTTKRELGLKDYYIAIGGILLFCVLVYFIHIETVWTSYIKVYFFLIIFLGTIANGGISESKLWGVILWAINFVVLTPAFLFYYQISEPILLSLMVLIIIYSLIIFSKTIFKRKNNSYS